MNRNYVVDAVVMKHRPIGEADRLITFYTNTTGKVNAVARSVRKPGSKFGGSLDILNHVRLSLARGRSLDHVSESDVINSHRGIKENLDRMAQAIYIMELVDTFGEDRSANRELFASTVSLLNEYDTGVNVDYETLKFEMQLLKSTGFVPEFLVCVKCRSELLPESHLFDSSSGGVLCEGCRHGVHGQTQMISIDSMKVLRNFQRSRYGDGHGSVDFSTEVSAELRRLMQMYLRFTAEKDLKTTGFMDQVSKLD